MNKRINDSKGMTIVEVLVSVIIISLIMGVLFTLLLQVQKINGEADKRSSIALAQNVITKAIERDMIEIGVKSISACNFNEFGFNQNVIDSYEQDGNTKYNYECIRVEYNQSYDLADVGYLMVYKQSSSQDDPAWVIRYGRGYYNDCEKDAVPDFRNWKETYSVVQKLDSDVDLKIIPSENEVTYSALYESNKKYSEQKLNNGKLFIPLQDENGYTYNIDLSFSFRLYNATYESISDANTSFICDNSSENLECKCTGKTSDCAKTDTPVTSKDEHGKYLYKCSESKASLGSVVGMNKNFIDLSSVTENGIYASRVKSVTFMSLEDYTNRFLKNTNPGDNTIRSSVDVSYSQNGTNPMYFEKDDDSMYNLYITQTGGVKVYGHTLTNMFKNFTNLESVDFTGFSTTGITSMNSMFYNCPKLNTLDGFTLLDFSSVTDVSSMFYKNTALTVSPFRGLELPSVLYANSLFNESGITGVFDYKTDFNAINVVSLRNFLRKSAIASFVMDYDNQEMPNLISINSMLCYTRNMSNATFKNTVVKHLKDMERVFTFSTLSKSIFDNFITEDLNSLYGLYDNCTRLTSFTFNNLNTEKVVAFSDMFLSCSNIKDIDLSGFSFASANGFVRIFANCSSLLYVTFGSEDSDVSLDNVQSLDQAFMNCYNFRGFKGKHVTFHGATSASQIFSGAGTKALFDSNYHLDVSDLELYNCNNFKNMFSNTLYGSIDVSGIHSKVTSTTVNLTSMFDNSRIHYAFLNDAEFQTKVNMTSMFSSCNDLTFVSGVEYTYEGLTRYLGGEGDLIKNNGKSPFDRFMIDDGYASTLTNMFKDCKYLRGFEEGYLDGIQSPDWHTTTYTGMFEGAFSVDILSDVTFTKNYKEIYQLVLPFSFNTSNLIGPQNNIFKDTGNLAVIKFKNAQHARVSSSSDDLNTSTTFSGFGSKAIQNKRVDSLDVYLGDMRICKYTTGESTSTCSYDNNGFGYLFSWLGVSSATSYDNFTRFNVDGVDGVKVNVYLSSTCSVAKKQYSESKSALDRSSNNKTNFVWPSGCSA